MIGKSIIAFSIRNPKTVTALLILCTLLLASLMVKVRVDTDPENMLSADEPRPQPSLTGSPSYHRTLEVVFWVAMVLVS